MCCHNCHFRQSVYLEVKKGERGFQRLDRNIAHLKTLGWYRVGVVYYCAQCLALTDPSRMFLEMMLKGHEHGGQNEPEPD